MQKANILKRITIFVLGTTILFTVLIANLAVVFRYVIEKSLPWSDELLRFIFVWVVFIGVALVYRKDELVDMTLVADLAKGKLALFLDVLRHMLTFIFVLIIAYQSLIITLGQLRTGEISAAMEIPVWLVSAGLVIGSAIWAYYGLLKIYATLKRLFTSTS